MNKNVPKLRFKDKNDADYIGWDSAKLKKYIDQFIVPMRDKPKIFDGNIPWCRIEDIEGKYINDSLSKQYVSKDIVSEMNLKVYPKDTVICSCSANLGICAITTKELITNQTFIGLVPKNNINTDFLYYRMLGYKKRLNKLGSGTTIAYLSRVEFENLKVKVPSLQEQEKIADFFTILDSLIEEQHGKVSDLELYKKGMMQKIFSQEIRFKDENGCDYPAWEEKELNSLANKITEKNKGFKVNNVISNSAKDGLIKQREFFDKDIANQSNIDGYYIIKHGDFVYNPRKSNYAPYGPINMYKIQEDGVVSPLYLCFRVNEKVNEEYIELYFKSTCWHRYIYKNSDQGVRHDRVSIKDSEFMKTVVLLPSLVEQRKIVEFLYNISELEGFEKQKLVDLKEMKKGLLQQMFI